jgi:hypothetical protein
LGFWVLDFGFGLQKIFSAFLILFEILGVLEVQWFAKISEHYFVTNGVHLAVVDDVLKLPVITSI